MTVAERASTVVEEFRRLSLDLLAEVSVAFFDNRGVEVKLVEEDLEADRRVDLALGAMMGFVSDHFRGTLALAPSAALAATSHPTEPSGGAGGDDGEALADWVGEMANQVLGRLKNQLLRYGVTLLFDTPMTVAGKARIGGIRRPATRLAFESDHGSLMIWWDVQIDDDMVLSARGESARPEGEMVLF